MKNKQKQREKNEHKTRQEVRGAVACVRLRVRVSSFSLVASRSVRIEREMERTTFRLPAIFVFGLIEETPRKFP